MADFSTPVEDVGGDKIVVVSKFDEAVQNAVVQGALLATNTGGTNNVTATVDKTIKDGAMIILPVINTVTDTMTLTIGGKTYNVLTNGGNPISAGGLVAGMKVIGVLSFSALTYQLMTWQDALASEALAERFANEDEDVVIRNEGGVNRYSANHFSKKSEASAGSAAISSASAGIASGRLEITDFSEFDDFVYEDPSPTQRLVAEGDIVVHRKLQASYPVAPEGASDNPFSGAGGVKLYAEPLQAEYTDRQFLVAADGSDETANYQKIAQHLPAGKTLRIVGAGTRVIGTQLTFSQPNIKIIADAGAEFLQAPDTRMLDKLLVFNGERTHISGLSVNGNIGANGVALDGNGVPLGQSETYTGKGQLIEVAGANSLVENVKIEGSQDKDDSPSGLFINANNCTVRHVICQTTGRLAIRDGGDNTLIEDVRGFDQYGLNGVAGCKLITKDKTIDGNPFTRATYRDIYAKSAFNGWLTLILFDHDGVQGGRVLCENLACDYANNTGPNVIKFVYCDIVEINGADFRHAGDGADNSSLRFQEGVTKIYLRNVRMDGGLNIDTEASKELYIDGSCYFGRSLEVPGAVQQWGGGPIVIGDGARFDNCKSYLVSLNTTAQAFASQVAIGAVQLKSAAGFSGVPIVNATFASTLKRPSFGQFRASAPLKSEGFRSFGNEGRWIMLSEAQEVAAQQDGRYYAANTQFPLVAEVEGCMRGMQILKRSPSAGDAAIGQVCVTAGHNCSTAWLGSTVYSVGDWVSNGGNVYGCTQAGTSAASGGPTGTGDSISDNGVIWKYLAPAAVWKNINAAIAA